MLPSDFKDFNIRKFTPSEVIKTGAKLGDVQPRLMQHYEYFRRAIGRRVRLTKNGLTSGGHRDPLHPAGLAGDSYLDKRDGEIKPSKIVACGLEAGFHSIGLYFTETTGWIGQHLGLSEDYRFWWGIKKKGARRWKYFGLVANPSDLIPHIK